MRVVYLFIARGHRRACPGGAVILPYVVCEASAHRRVHPGGGVIVHYSRGWQPSIAFWSEKSSLHRAKPGGGVPSLWGSRIVQSHRSTGINPVVAIEPRDVFSCLTHAWTFAPLSINECTPHLAGSRGRYRTGRRRSMMMRPYSEPDAAALPGDGFSTSLPYPIDPVPR